MRVFVILMAIFTLLVGTSGRPYQQPTDSRYFNETQHTVGGEFLTYFNQAGDSLLLFGYPITDAIPNPVQPGRQVQYFQRARMELNPDAPVGQRVSLTHLGSLLLDENRHSEDPGVDNNNGSCRFFATTGHYVCYAFRQFYDLHNGETYFGNPISDVEKMDGWLVQYFENARMEWHPEAPMGMRVKLSDLGKMHCDLIGCSTGLTPGGDIVARGPVKLIVNAFASRPLVRVNEKQVIFIVVQDQDLKPVRGAQVIVNVKVPGTNGKTIRADETNQNGITHVDLTVDSVDPNTVIEVEIHVEYLQVPEAAAKTWFRVWW